MFEWMFSSTEEKINKLDKELENANDLLAAARQRGKIKLLNNYKPLRLVFTGKREWVIVIAKMVRALLAWYGLKIGVESILISITLKI